MPRSLLLIGIGNDYRSDDGVGLAAIRVLKTREHPDTQFGENSGDGADLMEIWKHASMVIIIDAVSSGAQPGTIYRFDALAQPIPAEISLHSTHAFGIAEALGLAQALNQLPPRLIVYAIEGRNFNAGVGLSPEVAEAMQEVVEQVTHEVQDYFAD